MLEAHQEAGTIEIAQVDLLRQNIETERSNLLQAQVNLANTLDIFKAGTLGLPPNMPVELDDSMIEQFRLVDPKTTAVAGKDRRFHRACSANCRTSRPGRHLEKSVEVIGQSARSARLSGLRSRTPISIGSTRPCPSGSKCSTSASRKQLQEDRDKLNASAGAIWKPASPRPRPISTTAGELAETDPAKSADDLVTLASSLSGMTQELSLVQARARLEAISLPKINLDPKRAMDIARANRLDWMNNRMGVVDTWRLIYFNANQLKSGLNLTFSGAMNTTNNNPVQFNGATGDAERRRAVLRRR